MLLSIVLTGLGVYLFFGIIVLLILSFKNFYFRRHVSILIDPPLPAITELLMVYVAIGFLWPITVFIALKNVNPNNVE